MRQPRGNGKLKGVLCLFSYAAHVCMATPRSATTLSVKPETPQPTMVSNFGGDLQSSALADPVSYFLATVVFFGRLLRLGNMDLRSSQLLWCRMYHGLCSSRVSFTLPLPRNVPAPAFQQTELSHAHSRALLNLFHLHLHLIATSASGTTSRATPAAIAWLPVSVCLAIRRRCATRSVKRRFQNKVKLCTERLRSR